MFETHKLGYSRYIFGHLHNVSNEDTSLVNKHTKSVTLLFRAFPNVSNQHTKLVTHVTFLNIYVILSKQHTKLVTLVTFSEITKCK